MIFRSAGPNLKSFFSAALAHAEVKPFDRAEFTFHLWDGSTEIEPPESISENDAYLKGKDLIGLRSSNYFYFVDSREKTAFVFIKDPNAIPLYEIASPLKTVFHWWLRSKGHQIVHAAAVGNRSGGILIAGKSGSGKSTTALSCLSSALSLMADDFVDVYFNNDIPFASPLYSSAKLLKQFVHKFPDIGISAVTDPKWQEDEKSLFFLHQHFKNKMIDRFPLKAVTIAHYTQNENTTVEEISPISAISAVAPNTLLQLPDSGATEFERLKKIIKSLPCYRLNTGKLLTEIPNSIEKLLGRL